MQVYLWRLTNRETEHLVLVLYLRGDHSNDMSSTISARNSVLYLVYRNLV